MNITRYIFSIIESQRLQHHNTNISHKNSHCFSHLILHLKCHRNTINMYCNLCIYLAPYEYYIPSSPGPSCYCVAPLLRQLGFDTERIIVHFSSKGVEPHHGIPSPYGHSCTVRATVCITVMPSTFQPSATVSRPTEAAPPSCYVALYGDHIIGRELILDENSSPVGSVEVEPTTFRTVARDR